MTLHGGKNIQEFNSNFNAHRADVIRCLISTNLATSIASFSNYSTTGEEFIMPKISETDWELLENNICIATFFQGIRIQNKVYNNYVVIPNNYNKEYVDENDIYILKNDNTYAKANDSTLSVSTIFEKLPLGYEPGLARINFEIRGNGSNKYFNPISYISSGTSDLGNISPYLESYSSIVGSSKLNSIARSDMYIYMRNLDNSNPNYKRLKTVYYTALGREREGSFKYTNNEII